jgi:hypothetical protein
MPKTERLTKFCNFCKEEKSVSLFGKDATRYDGITYKCLACRKVERTERREALCAEKRKHYADNRDRLLSEKRAKYAENKEKMQARGRAYHAKNREALREKSKLYYKRNPDYYKDFRKRFPEKLNAKEIRRKTTKIQRTPAWLDEGDFWMMEQAYELAALRTKMFGFVWHVDHILPLNGKTVSGFHVPTNLQVIPGKENLVKSNKFWG